MIFYPRPPSLREADPKALEEFRCDQLRLAQPCRFVNILIPSADKVIHDHSYCSRGQRTEQSSSDMTANSHTEQERFSPITSNFFVQLHGE